MKSLLSFAWMRGYRTYAIIGFVIVGWAMENLLGIDIPNVEFSADDILLALGLGTARVAKV